MSIEIRITADGSPTLYVPELDETYHSQHGSVQEANHVFIQHGLTCFREFSEPIRILEVGYGTGLNALLTAQYASEKGLPIHYVGLEAFPISDSIWTQLNYLQSQEGAALYASLMEATWNEAVHVFPGFTLEKRAQKLQEFSASTVFDLVYFDAFGPKAQSEMWALETLRIVYQALKTGGVLVTYCAQGQFKRALKALGFVVESLPGPPGKREMTRARKI
ncbi:MAG: hypothetical protein RLZZ301_950 [Bacteroidota bacterium]|jgi:tRNA U34 5-methylaminomethyl-2-thiouridine-forming methyltransferase MnmC